MGCGRLVKPFDTLVRVHQHHAIGRGLQSAQKIGQTLVTLRQLELEFSALTQNQTNQLGVCGTHVSGKLPVGITQPIQHRVHASCLRDAPSERAGQRNAKSNQQPPIGAREQV